MDMRILFWVLVVVLLCGWAGQSRASSEGGRGEGSPFKRGARPSHSRHKREGPAPPSPSYGYPGFPAPSHGLPGSQSGSFANLGPSSVFPGGYAPPAPPPHYPWGSTFGAGSVQSSLFPGGYAPPAPPPHYPGGSTFGASSVHSPLFPGGYAPPAPPPHYPGGSTFGAGSVQGPAPPTTLYPGPYGPPPASYPPTAPPSSPHRESNNQQPPSNNNSTSPAGAVSSRLTSPPGYSTNQPHSSVPFNLGVVGGQQLPTSALNLGLNTPLLITKPTLFPFPTGMPSTPFPTSMLSTPFNLQHNYLHPGSSYSKPNNLYPNHVKPYDQSTYSKPINIPPNPYSTVLKPSYSDYPPHNYPSYTKPPTGYTIRSITSPSNFSSMKLFPESSQQANSDPLFLSSPAPKSSYSPPYGLPGTFPPSFSSPGFSFQPGSLPPSTTFTSPVSFSPSFAPLMGPASPQYGPPSTGQFIPGVPTPGLSRPLSLPGFTSPPPFLSPTGFSGISVPHHHPTPTVYYAGHSRGADQLIQTLDSSEILGLQESTAARSYNKDQLSISDGLYSGYRPQSSYVIQDVKKYLTIPLPSLPQLIKTEFSDGFANSGGFIPNIGTKFPTGVESVGLGSGYTAGYSAGYGAGLSEANGAGFNNLLGGATDGFGGEHGYSFYDGKKPSSPYGMSYRSVEKSVGGDYDPSMSLSCQVNRQPPLALLQLYIKPGSGVGAGAGAGTGAGAGAHGGAGLYGSPPGGGGYRTVEVPSVSEVDLGDETHLDRASIYGGASNIGQGLGSSLGLGLGNVDSHTSAYPYYDPLNYLNLPGFGGSGSSSGFGTSFLQGSHPHYGYPVYREIQQESSKPILGTDVSSNAPNNSSSISGKSENPPEHPGSVSHSSSNVADGSNKGSPQMAPPVHEPSGNNRQIGITVQLPQQTDPTLANNFMGLPTGQAPNFNEAPPMRADGQMADTPAGSWAASHMTHGGGSSLPLPPHLGHPPQMTLNASPALHLSQPPQMSHNARSDAPPAHLSQPLQMAHMISQHPGIPPQDPSHKPTLPPSRSEQVSSTTINPTPPKEQTFNKTSQSMEKQNSQLNSQHRKVSIKINDNLDDSETV